MQRKRHINFKNKSRTMLSSYSTAGVRWTSPHLKNRIRSSRLLTPCSRIRNLTYSFSNSNSTKSNVLYSIPCGCAFALLLIGIFNLLISNKSYAICIAGSHCSGTISDQDTISPVSGTTNTPATVSLSLSNTNMSQTTTPGNIAAISTDVTVSVHNAESYNLSLKMDSDKLISGNTTINAGNVITNNTWGYSWDGATNYTTPSTSDQILAVPGLSNGNISFTKTLKFGAKFATNAASGHYKGSGTLSLVATPRVAVVTLANLTQMQQLAEGYAPEACANTPYLDGQNYSAEYTLTDVRDGSTYTVRKLGDSKCWMTQNLKLWNKNANVNEYYLGGRVLKSSTSDISASTWTLPASGTSGFSNDAASNIYYNYSNSTGYYTWCATTAGTCNGTTSGGQNAGSSICPKGWKLPTGGTSGNTDFYNLFKNMQLNISGSLATSGSTNWQDDDLSIVQGLPYNFAYTGYMSDSSLSYTSSGGYWWARTADGSSAAYGLLISGSGVSPGTSNGIRSLGFAIRCVAEKNSDGGHYDIYE